MKQSAPHFWKWECLFSSAKPRPLTLFSPLPTPNIMLTNGRSMKETCRKTKYLENLMLFLVTFLMNLPGFFKRKKYSFCWKRPFRGRTSRSQAFASSVARGSSWASGRPCCNQKQHGSTRGTKRKLRLSEVWEESLSKVPGVSIKKQNWSQEIALWLCLASGSMNSEQMIDKYLLSYLVFAPAMCLLSLFAQICLSALPICTRETAC